MFKLKALHVYVILEAHLKVFHIWEAGGNIGEQVVVQVKFSQPWHKGETAVLQVPDVVKAKTQPGKLDAEEK